MPRKRSTKKVPISKYSQVLAELNYEISQIKSNYSWWDEEKNRKVNEKRSTIYAKYFNQYLMPQDIWDKRLKSEEINFKDKKFAAEMYKEKIYHFCYQKPIGGFNLRLFKFYCDHCFDRPKLLNNEFDYYPNFGANNGLVTSYNPNMLKLFELPHSKINQYLKWFEQISAKPITKELKMQCQKMEKLYMKIKASEDNLEEWLECLQEANNPEFVRHNFEERIGNNLNDLNLWKLYIEYLRKVNSKEMLQVYSKYCRFFLDDTEMKDKYKIEVEKYGKVYVSWKNPFPFECYDFGEEKKVEEKNDDWLLPLNLPFFYEYSNNNKKMFKQNWSLPHFIIQYIVDKARPFVYANIQQTCKYFFIKKPILFCYAFVCCSNSTDNLNLQIEEQSMIFNSKGSMKSLKPFENKKLVLTLRLDIRETNHSSFLSNFLQNHVYDCDLKNITFMNQRLFEKELKFLLHRGNVESFVNCYSRITDSKGNLLYLENILKLLPNIRDFRYRPLETDSIPTLNTLSEFEFKNKLINFEVDFIANEINPADLFSFVQKNAAPSSSFELKFNYNVDEAYTKLLNKSKDLFLKEWIPYEERPSLYISKHSFDWS